LNCRECLGRLEQYVDRELDESEIVIVRRHLSDCPPCEEHFQLRVEMKRLVKVSCDQSRAPAHLLERLTQILG
jgi:mycothiol system anti-sigma-R factor